MIKINKPTIPAKIYIKYNGSRLNLIQEYNAFTNAEIKQEAIFGNIKESITIEVRLFDNKKYHLGLISRKIYTEINNELTEFENGFLIHHSIILDNQLTFFSGLITMDIELNDEVITERYLFKVFIKSPKAINKYIINSEIACENFTLE